MTSTQSTLYDIAAILSYESDVLLLEKSIKSNKINWDDIVIIASQHLVLTTVYCRLQQKKLLHFLPQELQEYLSELTAINRNRNKDLLAEVEEITTLFNKKNINYVLLKGTALLTANYYQDYGERMITDIDILVAENQIKEAKELIIAQGYISAQETIGDRHLNKRHIPRLINKTKLAAVELHTSLLKKNKTALLNPIEVLNEKVYINETPIPKPQHLLKHTILNFQINNKGNYYNSLSYRSAYDSIIILNKEPQEITLSSFKETIFQKYVLFLSIFFPGIWQQKQSFKFTILKKFFLFKQNHKRFNSMWVCMLNKLLYTHILLNRLKLFILNKNYRHDIIKKYNF